MDIVFAVGSYDVVFDPEVLQWETIEDMELGKLALLREKLLQLFKGKKIVYVRISQKGQQEFVNLNFPSLADDFGPLISTSGFPCLVFRLEGGSFLKIPVKSQYYFDPTGQYFVLWTHGFYGIRKIPENDPFEIFLTK